MPSDSRTDTEKEPRIGEEQLEALQALAEFEDVELRALRELAQDRASDYVNRRSLIKGAGALAGMGIAGSVGYNEGVQQAQAAGASASDSDGDVGTPSSPVDVFADGLTAAEGPSEVRNAAPGDVQTEINNAASASNGRGLVRLNSERDYDFTGITVKSGVTLDYNGAVNVVTTDADVHIIEDEAQVLNARFDLNGITYTSNLFVLDGDVVGDIGGGGATVVGETRCEVVECTGEKSNGTMFYLHQNGNSIQGVKLYPHGSIGTVIDAHSESNTATTDYINDIEVGSGWMREFGTLVHARGPGDLDGWALHCHANCSGATNYGLRLASGNCEGWVYDGTLWDWQNAGTAAISVASGCADIVVDVPENRYNSGKVTNNAGPELQILTDNDGPPRNLRSSARMYLQGDGTGQDITAGSEATVLLDTAPRDVLGEADTTNNQIVLTHGGIYQISAAVTFRVGADGDTLRAEVEANGGAILQNKKDAGGAGNNMVSMSDIVALSAGDTLELTAANETSADTIEDGSAFTYLSIHRLGSI